MSPLSSRSGSRIELSSAMLRVLKERHDRHEEIQRHLTAGSVEAADIGRLSEVIHLRVQSAPLLVQLSCVTLTRTDSSGLTGQCGSDAQEMGALSEAAEHWKARERLLDEIRRVRGAGFHCCSITVASRPPLFSVRCGPRPRICREVRERIARKRRGLREAESDEAEEEEVRAMCREDAARAEEALAEAEEQMALSLLPEDEDDTGAHRIWAPEATSRPHPRGCAGQPSSAPSSMTSRQNGLLLQCEAW